MLLEEEISNCDSCSFRQQCSVPLAPISTWQNIKLMVVNEKPTFEEESTQTSWFDRHNQYVSKLLYQFFPPKNVHLTNLVKCYTTDNIGVRNSQICKEKFLYREINELKPNIILALGKTVGSILLSIPKPEFGDIILTGKTRTYYIAMWQSASYVFNSGKTHEKKFVEFLKKLKNLSETINVAQN